MKLFELRYILSNLSQVVITGTSGKKLYDGTLSNLNEKLDHLDIDIIIPMSNCRIFIELED